MPGDGQTNADEWQGRLHKVNPPAMACRPGLHGPESDGSVRFADKPPIPSNRCRGRPVESASPLNRARQPGDGPRNDPRPSPRPSERSSRRPGSAGRSAIGTPSPPGALRTAASGTDWPKKFYRRPSVQRFPCRGGARSTAQPNAVPDGAASHTPPRPHTDSGHGCSNPAAYSPPANRRLRRRYTVEGPWSGG